MAGMTSAEEILAELEALRIRVEPRGRYLELVGPKGALPAKLAQEIRQRRAEIIELVSLQGWPNASRESLRRFHRPEARLYPFLNRTVITPHGRGRLVAILPESATVVPDQGPRRLICLLPSEIRPAGYPHLPGEPFEAVS